METYILESSKLTDSTIEVGYLNGCLKLFKMELNQVLTAVQLNAISERLKLANNEHEFIAAFTEIGLTPVLSLKTNEKIALFCKLYEVYVGVKYKVSPADSGKIKHIKLDQELLLHYFTSDNFLFKDKYSISNLVKYYNELLAEISKGKKGKYINYWDEGFEAKLTPNELKEYWAHLRSLGLEARKEQRTGKTIDWVKKQ